MARDASAKSIQDQIQYCDRCGISFLWSAEERRQAGTGPAPLLCPGCRKLLPAAGRERGLVKWFSNRRHYGFIIRYNEPDIFVHGSQIKDSKRLRTGDVVEFAVTESERGLTATSVCVLFHVDMEIA